MHPSSYHIQKYLFSYLRKIAAWLYFKMYSKHDYGYVAKPLYHLLSLEITRCFRQFEAFLIKFTFPIFE